MTTSPPDADDATPGRSAATDELWAEVKIDPIMVALPAGVVGYTLRAYRSVGDLTPTDVSERDAEHDDPFARQSTEEADDDAAPARAFGGPDAADAEPGPEDFADEPDEDAAAEEDPDEEVPIFLTHRGRLLLFGSPESLAGFIGSNAPHDLTQLDTWEAIAKRVQPADIAPTDDDSYELDLVVENLRGGHDAWDLPLLISAGELARDLAYALRLEPVLAAMAPGSPLDNLDDALRAASAGAIKGLVGRRRLRKIGAQQASLGWRTIIGKISAAVDWRD